MNRVRKNESDANYMDLVFVVRDGVRFDAADPNKVVVDMENTGFFNRVAQKFFKRPPVSHIALDQYGSAVWMSMDGKRTVYDVVRKMEAAFPDEKADMLKRVVAFFRMLERYEWIERR